MRRLAVVALVLALAGCGGSHRAAPSPAPVVGATYRQPTATQVRRWPTTFCSFKPGDGSAALIAAMGPSGIRRFPGQATWSGFGWQLNAFFNLDGTIRQMNAAAPAGSTLPCPSSR